MDWRTYTRKLAWHNLWHTPHMPGGSAESYKNGQDSQWPSQTENEHQLNKPEAGNLQGRFFWSGVKKHCSPTAINFYVNGCNSIKKFTPAAGLNFMILQQPLTLKLYNRQVNVSSHHSRKSALSSSDWKQASKTFRLLSLNITADKWSDAV